jgi:hypothetical protein
MGTLRFAHPTLLIPYQDLFENEIALKIEVSCSREERGPDDGICGVAESSKDDG